MSKRDRVFTLRAQGYTAREISMELKVSQSHVAKVLNEGQQTSKAVTNQPRSLKSVYRRMYLQSQLSAAEERAKYLRQQIEELSADATRN